MYIPKDIQARLRFEAKMARHAECRSWEKLFHQAAYALRQKDREIEKLNRIIDMNIDEALNRMADYGKETDNGRA
jgi:hypothetical protein